MDVIWVLAIVIGGLLFSIVIGLILEAILTDRRLADVAQQIIEVIEVLVAGVFGFLGGRAMASGARDK